MLIAPFNEGVVPLAFTTMEGLVGGDGFTDGLVFGVEVCGVLGGNEARSTGLSPLLLTVSWEDTCNIYRHMNMRERERERRKRERKRSRERGRERGRERSINYQVFQTIIWCHW